MIIVMIAITIIKTIITIKTIIITITYNNNSNNGNDKRHRSNTREMGFIFRDSIVSNLNDKIN